MKSIAWVVPGGLGTGRDNIGVPVMEEIVTRLGTRYSVTVFQLFPVNDGYEQKNFEIIPVVSSNLVGRVFKFFRLFRQAHRRKDFIAVHGFWVLPSGFLATLVGRLHNIRTVVSVLGGDGVGLKEINYGRLNSATGRMLSFLTLHKADEALVLTRFLADKLHEAGLRNRPLKVIPWGVDQRLFTFRDKELSAPIRFLHVANFHPVKNQELLLSAFDEIRKVVNARLLMIGEGVDADKVTVIIDLLKLQDCVEIVSPVRYQDLPAYYHNADILLHTSLSEGQSEVVTEAMSCGVLVCGTRVGLMYDEPECCRAVDPGDAGALAAAVVELIGDRAAQLRIRTFARQWTTRFDIEWTVDSYSKCYEADMK